MLKAFLPVVVLVVCLGAAYSLFMRPPAVSNHEAAAIAPMVVKTQTVSRQTFQPLVASFGVLQAREQVNLVAQVGGEVVSVASQFRTGAFVRKGDVLLQVDPADYAVQIRIATGQLSETKAALQEELGRVQQARQDWAKVGREGKAPALALREPQLAAAQAKVEAAEAQLELARLNESRTQIKAPFDGLVLEASLHAGQVISAGAGIGSLVATAKGEVRLGIKSSDLAFLRIPVQGEKGVPVTFINRLGHPEQSWSGVIVGSEGGVDRDTQQLTLISEIREPFQTRSGQRPLKIGQYLQAQIEGIPQSDAILVPLSAVYQNSYVYLLQDGRLMRRSVSIGWQGATEVQVRDGLEPGDILVVTPLGQVGSGTPAVAETVEAKGDAHD